MKPYNFEAFRKYIGTSWNTKSSNATSSHTRTPHKLQFPLSQLLLQGGSIAKNQQSTSSSCQHHLMLRIATVKSIMSIATRVGKMRVLVNLKQSLAYFHRLPASQIVHLCCKHAICTLCPTGHNVCTNVGLASPHSISASQPKSPRFLRSQLRFVGF